MALTKTLPDPFGGPDLDGCYLKWRTLVIDTEEEEIRVIFSAYRSEAARRARKARLPIPFELRVGPVGVPATLDEAGAVLVPADPSYAELAGALNGTGEQPGLADGLGAMIYGFAKSRPELADAEDA